MADTIDAFEEPTRTRTYVVAIYTRDKAFGGPEEGGWWYDTGALQRLLRTFKNEDRAWQYATRVNHWLNRFINRHRPSIHSVLSRGELLAEVHDNFAPDHYPETQPVYE